MSKRLVLPSVGVGEGIERLPDDRSAGSHVATVRPVPLSDVLHRFRRFRAPPGPPARAVGVPVAPGEELAAELAPLFVELDAIEAETRALREAADEQAEERLKAARERAARIMASAREHVDAERERALGLRRSATQSEAALLASAAAAEAAAIRAAGEKRLPGLVAAVLACIEKTSTIEDSR